MASKQRKKSAANRAGRSEFREARFEEDKTDQKAAVFERFEALVPARKALANPLALMFELVQRPRADWTMPGRIALE